MRRLDITGQRFGLLTAERSAGLSDDFRNVIWLFRCDCGWRALRRASYVRWAVSMGKEPACARCRVEARRGDFEWSHQRNREIFLAQWLNGDGLWSPQAEEALADRIREELEPIIGKPTAPPDQCGYPAPKTIPEPILTPWCSRCSSHLVVPIEKQEHCWACERCKRKVDQAYGCLSCARVTCEKHTEMATTDRVATLLLIGTKLGITRERARQIEDLALRRLYRNLTTPKRSKYHPNLCADCGGPLGKCRHRELKPGWDI